jgi:hypothetical protein
MSSSIEILLRSASRSLRPNERATRPVGIDRAGHIQEVDFPSHVRLATLRDEKIDIESEARVVLRDVIQELIRLITKNVAAP